MPRAWAAIEGRDLLSEARRMRSPSPGPARRFARGTRQSFEAEGDGGGGPHSHLVLAAGDGEAGRVALDHEGGDRAPRVVDLRPLAEDEEELGDVAAADEGLLAGDHDLVAGGGEAGAHRGRVRAGRRLGDDEGPEAAPRDPGEEARLLLRRTEVDERLHGVEGGGVDDAGRGTRPGEELHALEVGAEGEEGALMGIGDEDRVEAELVEGGDVVGRELRRPVVVGGAGRDHLVREACDGVEDEPFLLAPLAPVLEPFQEVHGVDIAVRAVVSGALGRILRRDVCPRVGPGARTVAHPGRSSRGGNGRASPEISPAFVARAWRCRCDKAHGPKDAEGVVDTTLKRLEGVRLVTASRSASAAGSW